MTIKRRIKAPLILPVEDHRKATQFVALLFAVGSRVGKPRKSKGKTTKKGEWVRENICEPCFFEVLFYQFCNIAFKYFSIMKLQFKLIIILIFYHGIDSIEL